MCIILSIFTVSYFYRLPALFPKPVPSDSVNYAAKDQVLAIDDNGKMTATVAEIEQHLPAIGNDIKKLSHKLDYQTNLQKEMNYTLGNHTEIVENISCILGNHSVAFGNISGTLSHHQQLLQGIGDKVTSQSQTLDDISITLKDQGSIQLNVNETLGNQSKALENVEGTLKVHDGKLVNISDKAYENALQISDIKSALNDHTQRFNELKAFLQMLKVQQSSELKSIQTVEHRHFVGVKSDLHEKNQKMQEIVGKVDALGTELSSIKNVLDEIKSGLQEFHKGKSVDPGVSKSTWQFVAAVVIGLQFFIIILLTKSKDDLEQRRSHNQATGTKAIVSTLVEHYMF